MFSIIKKTLRIPRNPLTKMVKNGQKSSKSTWSKTCKWKWLKTPKIDQISCRPKSYPVQGRKSECKSPKSDCKKATWPKVDWKNQKVRKTTKNHPLWKFYVARNRTLCKAKSPIAKSLKSDCKKSNVTKSWLKNIDDCLIWQNYDQFRTF